MNKPKNNYEAYKLALKLAITADTEEKANDCVTMATQIETSLTELEIARAKKEASYETNGSFIKENSAIDFLFMHDNILNLVAKIPNNQTDKEKLNYLINGFNNLCEEWEEEYQELNGLTIQEAKDLLNAKYEDE